MNHYYEEFGLRIVAWAGDNEQRAKLMATDENVDTSDVGIIFSTCSGTPGYPGASFEVMLVPFDEWARRSDAELLEIMRNGDPASIDGEIINTVLSPHDIETF